MSEGPPKKSVETDSDPAEKEDVIAIFDVLHSLFGDIDMWETKPPGSAVRVVRALNASYRSIEYSFQTGQEVGPAYVLYTQALRAVLSEQGLWDVLKETNGDAKIQELRDTVRGYLAILESQTIDNFRFTGRKQ